MENKQQFEFQVDRKKNIIIINKNFLADRQLVWDCYTKSELLDQWYGPEPLSNKTKSMDFREGGHWHFAMVEPNGTEYWNLVEYLTIQPIDYYIAIDGFSNEQGEINEELPRAKQKVTFTDNGDSTMVQTVITYDSLEDLETIVKMGMEDGMKSTLERLDKILITLNITNQI